jgi:hypothetical protein
MLILEKIRNQYHQIWITVDREKRNTKFDCRLKGESKLLFIRTDLAPPLHCDGCLLIIVSFAQPNLFNKCSALPSAFPVSVAASSPS